MEIFAETVFVLYACLYPTCMFPLLYKHVLACFFFFSCQDLKSRRNPRLVPYALLDERTKKSNRDSLREAIRTMVGYGYDIDPPDQEGKNMLLLTQLMPHKSLINPGLMFLAKLKFSRASYNLG